MDKVTLFNRALQKLGEREYYRDSPSGKACDLWFPQVLHEALMFGAWSFATKEVELHPGKKEEGFEIPRDCIRVLEVDALRWRMRGRRIVLEKLWEGPGHGEVLKLTYLSNDLAKREELPEQEPLFCNGVMLLLASRLSMKLSSDPNMEIKLEQQAQEALSQALHLNVVQSHSNDQHPLVDILNQSLF